MRQVFVLITLAACHHYRVISFDVTPHAACPGEPVTVSWNVSGGARLAVIKGTKSPTPDQVLAAEQAMKSQDQQTFPVDETESKVIAFRYDARGRLIAQTSSNSPGGDEWLCDETP
jgi:hypothetical protein